MSKRKYGTRLPYKTIYIFTEGEKTEPNYFEAKRREVNFELRRRSINIHIKGKGYNTMSLVDFAIDYLSTNHIVVDEASEEDECWVIFDKDDFNKDFDNAIRKAEAKKIKVAYSNESFELWYLLHFDYFESNLSRRIYNSKLTNILRKETGDKNFKYHKNFKEMYQIIKSKESEAIKNAKKLLNKYDDRTPFSQKNPSTTVFVLVERLNSLLIKIPN